MKSYLNCPDQVINPIDNKLFSFWDSTQNYTFIYHLGIYRKLTGKFKIAPEIPNAPSEIQDVFEKKHLDCGMEAEFLDWLVK